MKRMTTVIALLLAGLLLLCSCGASTNGGDEPPESSADESSNGETVNEVEESEARTEGIDQAYGTEDDISTGESGDVTESTTAGSAMPGLTDERPTYVSLGDSIARGYGLADIEKERYSALIADALGIDESVVLNAGIDGQTSTELLQLMEASYYGIFWSEAELVTVSTGANNLLGVAMPALFMLMTDPAAGLATLNSPNFRAQLDAGVAQLAVDLPQILSVISEANPETEIVLLTVYNPFKGVKIEQVSGDVTATYDLGSMTDYYVCAVNEVILSTAKQYGCLIADVYTAFEESDAQVVNVTVDENGIITTSYDPHPNAAGHRLIADAVVDVYREESESLASE